MTAAQKGTLTPSTSMARPLPQRRPTRVGEVEVRRIEGRLSEEEVDKVTEVLVEAFADDPFSLHLVGGDMNLNPVQLRSVVGAANVGGVIVVGIVPPTAKGRPKTSENGSASRSGTCTPEENGRVFGGGRKSQVDGEIAGAMIFHAPGQYLNSTEEQKREGYYEFLEKVDAETRKWWTDYWEPLLARTCKRAFGEGTTTSAWDLHLFGVRPAYHGKGVASGMMRFAQELADADNAPMTLQTQSEQNVEMYERMGFKAKECIEMESPQGKSKFWFMIRQPEPKENGERCKEQSRGHSN